MSETIDYASITEINLSYKQLEVLPDLSMYFYVKACRKVAIYIATLNLALVESPVKTMDNLLLFRFNYHVKNY